MAPTPPHVRGSPGNPGRPSIPPRRSGRLGEALAPLDTPDGHTSDDAEVRVEEAGEAFAGRTHLLRLLRDGVERQRPLEREPREAAPRLAHREPRPREAGGEAQAPPPRDRQPSELMGRHSSAES